MPKNLRTTENHFSMARASRTLVPYLSHPDIQKVRRAGGSGQGVQPGPPMRVMPSGPSQLMGTLS